eukprot:2631144-Rhodomonas_salina.1
MDGTFASVVPGKMAHAVDGSRWQGMLQVGATEHITRALSEPNCNGVVFSANDCEDHTGSMIANFK